MEEKKEIKVRLSTVICMVVILALIVALGVTYYLGFVQNRDENTENGKLVDTSGNLVSNTAVDNSNKLDDETVKNESPNLDDDSIKNVSSKHIVLYNGYEINIGTGIQDPMDMKTSDENIKKYNITYYNYENGKYLGKTKGDFGEETYEGFSLVDNVKRIAISEKYDAIPRNSKKVKELPEELNDLMDCSSVDIESIDLDGDGKKEYIVCCTVNYEEGVIGDGEPQASSWIMLLDSNYKKIAELVNLENGFWANIKEEKNKIFLSLKDVEYIDIDKDGIMEIIIDVPTYEGEQLSIVKYNKGKIKGKTNYQASVQP